MRPPSRGYYRQVPIGTASSRIPHLPPTKASSDYRSKGRSRSGTRSAHTFEGAGGRGACAIRIINHQAPPALGHNSRTQKVYPQTKTTPGNKQKLPWGAPAPQTPRGLAREGGNGGGRPAAAPPPGGGGAPGPGAAGWRRRASGGAGQGREAGCRRAGRVVARGKAGERTSEGGARGDRVAAAERGPTERRGEPGERWKRRTGEGRRPRRRRVGSTKTALAARGDGGEWRRRRLGRGTVLGKYKGRGGWGETEGTLTDRGSRVDHGTRGMTTKSKHVA